ncbi:phosphonate metabolism protein/1,5-bisphosphokinase (PRPP-forming) PhnN, partial [Rhizobium johnstonii]
GLKYGIPAEISVALSRGHIVVANGSRSALHRFQAAFPRLKVVNVTAPKKAVMALKWAVREMEERYRKM